MMLYMHNQNQPKAQYNPQTQPYATGTQPNNGHNPYEFILQADTKPPQPPASFAKRLLLVVGGIFLLFMLLALALSFLLPKKGASEGVVAIAEEQQAIVALATSVATDAQSDTLKAFALNTQLVLQSDQKELTGYIKASGSKLDEKRLVNSSDAKATAKLETAKDTPNYDSTGREVLGSALEAYAGNLKTTYSQSKNQKEKAILQTAFANAGVLLEQNNPLATP